MVRQIGILIHVSKEHRSFLSIIDKDNGKFSATASRSDISRGSLISYSLNQRGTKSYITSIDVLDLPEIENEHDLLFFHQVLEIVYYFIPFGKSVPDIFYLLLYLYSSIERINSDALKKMFLFKLFAHLGFYPEEKRKYYSLFTTIRMGNIDDIICRKVDLSLERKLDRWLDYCISLHPCTKYFNAISMFMSRKP